mmetsp:Transcript_76399/g.184902  ORF Transcript_76399/g.184902 Transcript_76399/m.184902 type:complete len:203 (+) Transcript_76399:230-838(+)
MARKWPAPLLHCLHAGWRLHLLPAPPVRGRAREQRPGPRRGAPERAEQGQRHKVQEADLSRRGPWLAAVHEEGDGQARLRLHVALFKEFLLQARNPSEVHGPVQCQVAQVCALHGHLQQQHGLLPAFRRQDPVLAPLRRRRERPHELAVIRHIRGNDKIDDEGSEAAELLVRQMRQEVILGAEQEIEGSSHVVVFVHVGVVV